MKVVLLKDVRTSVGTYLSGQVVPAMPDGSGGWLMQVGMVRRDGRARTVHLPVGSARPARDARWRDRAACRDIPGDPWYPNRDGWGADIRAAREVCSRCPVRVECAQSALDNNEVHGVFAGVAARQPGAKDKLTAIASGRAS